MSGKRIWQEEGGSTKNARSTGSSNNLPNFTAPNFSKKHTSLTSNGFVPGNFSQQNSNPFGITNRGYKGTAIK